MFRPVDNRPRPSWQRLRVAVTPVLAVAALATVAVATGAGPEGTASAAEIRPPVHVTAAPAERPRHHRITIRIGTFNVLGSQHTARGGDRRRFPPASVRSRRAAKLIRAHHVQILGTQELQPDQLRALRSRTGMAAAYPGQRWGQKETDNSVLYDAKRFKLVSGSKFIIPFMGRPRPQPILRLEDRATGRQFYVVNTHPSAHGGRYQAERRRGQAKLVRVVKRLRRTGLPVLVTGDMNDRQKFYCHVVPPARLVAANGGSYRHGCRPPAAPVPVDWVVGSKGTRWTDYWRDTRPVERRISDHFLVSAAAHVRG